MNLDKKDCTMQFRCTNEQKNLIMKYMRESGATTQSEYILRCCLYGAPDNSHETLTGFLAELETLLIKVENGTLKKKEFIKLIGKEIDYAWSTLK